ncbi:MAG: T9SS type A sorting domain-containing protein [Bacteroidetes bacterium]|nr:T9SS type A sorting domain-containing protein [Bacteroidota bacterium]MBL6942785.1 T9SS type A sorting domain-containing protein [Bacteroidales bacterium]
MKRQKTKDKRQKLAISKMRKVLLLLIIFVLSSLYQTHAQQPLTFDKNISLPEESGGFGFDIVHANSKLFLHAQSKVFVYDDSTNNLIDTINLLINGNTIHNYGKYAPPYFNYNFNSPSRQSMAVDENNNLIYTITPDLNIISIETDGNFSTTTLALRPPIIDHFHISSGNVVIKHDPIHNRLYVLLSGRDTINTQGSFHMTDSYFAIYNINPGTDSLELIHNDFKRGISIADGGDSYFSTASDIEYNHNPVGYANSNKYYVARGKKLEVWEFSGTPGDPVQLVDSVFISAVKIGKLMTIKNGYLHKIIALPYRLPGSGIEPDSGYEIKFYAIDAYSQVLTCDSFIAPSKRILDAVFLSGNNTLAMTYTDDILYNNDTIFAGTDVAFYQYNQGGGVFVPQYNWNLYTNAYPQYDQSGNYNYPMKIVPGQNDDFYIGKINEVVHITETGSDPPYQSAQVIDKQGAYFANGGFAQNNVCFISLTLNGYYNIGAESTIIKQCGLPIYHSVYNPSNNSIYFYNTLNTDQSGIFVYNLDANNGNGQVETFIELDFPIGDVEYNPFQSHLLISLNTDSLGNIKVLKPDNTFDTDISVSGINHITEMFVSPNRQLSFLANTTSTNPLLVVYDAADYSLVDSSVITELIKFFNSNLNADFCYNPYNSTTYATVTNTQILNNPYLSIKNTVNNGSYRGILLSVSGTGETTVLKTDLRYPRKLICPEIPNPPENYQGSLYINTNDTTNKNNIAYFDCDSNNMTDVDFDPPIFFNDIAYNKATNSILAFSGQTITTPDSGHYANDRVARFYRIEKTDSGFVKNEIGYYEGQIAAFFSNPYNDMLYVHTKFDVNKFGDEPAKLLQYDPLSTNNTFTSVNLGVTSYYVEFDHFKDNLYSFYNYNLTTPYINPLQNKIYLPNGAHSNVSVVDFQARELMLLDSGINWISIPRHMGNITNQQYDPCPTSSVFANSNFETPYSKLSLSYNKAQLTPQQEFRATFNIYNPGGWDYQNDMDQTFSYRGYKLNIFQDSTANIITLRGNVEDPFRPIELYGGKHNWVGYFLYQEQDIFDALGITLNYLFKIEAKYWSCTYQGPFRNPGTPHQITEGWQCTDEFHTIDYGEMVELTTDYLEPGYTFIWQGNGQPVDGRLRDETEYFSYTETADYTPVFVLLDSTDNPSELATYVNDSCVGACIVLPGDTMVGILAYLDGQAGDSITFESWYNTKSTAHEKISSYSVYNPDKERYEQRSILLGENREFYKVSFRKHKYDSYNNDMQSILTDFWLYPNPSSQYFNIEYRLHGECMVNIEAYDIYGRRVAVIVNSNQLSGVQKLIWNLKGNSGHQVCPGIYTIKIVAGGETITKKVVIN